MKKSQRSNSPGHIRTFRVSPQLDAALDAIIEHRHEQNPLMPKPTLSDVLRSLVVKEYAQITTNGQEREPCA